MILGRMAMSLLALISASSVALAQSSKDKALQQLKDHGRSSQEAAATPNLEKAKVKSGQGVDTAQPPAVSAGTPSTISKAEREAEAIRTYTSKPPTGQAERARLQRAAVVPPAPGTKPAAPTPKPVAAAPIKPASTAAVKPAATTAVVKPAAAPAAPARPASVVAAPARPAPVAAAPVKPSTSTYTTSSSSSTPAAAPKR